MLGNDRSGNADSEDLKSLPILKTSTLSSKIWKPPNLSELTPYRI